MMTACDSISGYLWYVSLKPDTAFDQSTIPLAPDYSRFENWAAHPEIEDNSDISLGSKVFHAPSIPEVDVFFVHPTTYYSPESWNQPLDDKQANDLTDNWVLLNQAGIFSSCCDVYAPRYRQATLYSVLTDEPDGDKALELAYQDIKSSFEYYLDHLNRARPFVIASHSQGSWHSLRLIEELIASSRIREKLIAAYLVGMPLPADKISRTLNGMPICSQHNQSKCFVTWNTLTQDADTSFYHQYARIWYGQHYEENQGKELICVNPLSWRLDNEFASPILYKGGVNFKLDNAVQPELDIGVAGAQCINGILYITEPATKNYNWFLFGEGNYHMHDYDLFYANIKANVQTRIQSYFDSARAGIETDSHTEQKLDL